MQFVKDKVTVPTYAVAQPVPARYNVLHQDQWAMILLPHIRRLRMLLVTHCHHLEHVRFPSLTVFYVSFTTGSSVAAAAHLGEHVKRVHLAYREMFSGLVQL